MRLALVFLCACSVGEAGPGSGNPNPDSALADPDGPAGGTPGTLALTVTTTTANGPYAPKNCAVVWIENAGGTIVKTIDRKCGVRSQHLVAWTTASGGSGTDTDAVSSASRANHQTPLSITWDLKDRAGTIVPDGSYTIRMETTEENANNAAQNHQGTFTFTKGAQVDARSALSNGGFDNVSITFTPL